MVHKSNEREERERKALWLDKLNTVNPGWIDGDTESVEGKKADMVNHRNQHVIELKREKGGSLDNMPCNVERFSNRLQSYLRDADVKFASYPKYKSLLLVEMQSYIALARGAMSGIRQLHLMNSKVMGTSIRNKALYAKMENIGCIVFWPAPGSLNFGKVYYYDNPSGFVDRKISQTLTETILGNKLEFLN